MSADEKSNVPQQTNSREIFFAKNPRFLPKLSFAEHPNRVTTTYWDGTVSVVNEHSMRNTVANKIVDSLSWKELQALARSLEESKLSAAPAKSESKELLPIIAVDETPSCPLLGEFSETSDGDIMIHSLSRSNPLETANLKFKAASPPIAPQAQRGIKASRRARKNKSRR